VLAVCEDVSVVGAPFYLMELVDGAVLTSALPAALDTERERRRCCEELVDALAEVHAVDWGACGLAGFSSDPGRYLERQLRRFAGLWERHRTRDVPALDEVAAWLSAHLPRSGPATIVHGDYRLGNVMLSATAPARLLAIFDWELATLGDPLADVGYLCALWSERDDSDLGAFDLSPVTREPGFLTRDELVARYEATSGRAVTQIGWYRVLALWKAAIFMEGNYRRALAGTTDDPWLHGFGDGVLRLAERARELTR
jgi:aminoglycoside phosphotransferase (APT) family kinase protein